MGRKWVSSLGATQEDLEVWSLLVLSLLQGYVAQEPSLVAFPTSVFWNHHLPK